jgi:cellulose synthase/poly-beta-1,6-N-acetylglucosamine synthase-like glycosyltransferase
VIYLYAAALALLAVHGAHRAFLTLLALRRSPCPPSIVQCPMVTVQCTLYNELAVAARLLEAVGALDWPAERLEIQILDDSTDDTSAVCAAAAERMRARGLTVAHLRRTDRTGFKAGALEAGRAAAKGEILLVLDADFVPPPSLLRDMIGGFDDPRVGMVQVRWDHLNRDAGALTRAQGLLLDGHFAVEQAARAWSGRIFNFNGTAGAWRAAAIADAGGWHHDTLTEDLDLSYRAALRGWRFMYLRGARAPAELPATMRAFKSQQYRWAKGSIECARKLLPQLARAPLPWRVRLEAALHLTQNLAYLALVALLVTSAPVLAGRAAPEWLGPIGALATAIVLGGYAIVAARGCRRGALGALAEVPILLALTAGIALNQARAVLSGMAGRVSPFVRTPKDGAIGRARTRARYRVRRDRLWLAEAALAAYLTGGCVLALAHGALLGAAWLALFAIGCTWVALATVLDR